MYTKWSTVLFFLFCCYGSTVLAQKTLKIGDDPFIRDKSAVSEIQSITGGFLPPRLTTQQRDAIIAPAIGLMVYNTDKNCLEWYNGSSWYDGCNNPKSGGTAMVSSYSCAKASAGILYNGIAVTGVTQTITATVATVGSYSISAVANGVTFTASGTFATIGAQDIVLTATGTPIAPGSFTLTLNTVPGCTFSRTVGANALCDGSNPTAEVTFTSKTGKIWMDRNLGASRAATAIDDYGAYGCLYQFGRDNDGHASMAWTSGTTGSPINGTTATQSLTTTPGHNLFIIHYNYWHNASNNNLWQVVNGINNPCPAGYRVPSLNELQNEIGEYQITNAATAYASPFKFVLAGYRDGIDGNIYNAGLKGGYFTNYYTFFNHFKVYIFIFDSGSTLYLDALTNGHSVRCIKN